MLGLLRSTTYKGPVRDRQSKLRQFMCRIDALYLENPRSGRWIMLPYLAREGISITPDGIRSLMPRMCLRANHQNPRTTDPGDPYLRFPYLVDLRQVTSEDQVWATEITYIPLQ